MATSPPTAGDPEPSRTGGKIMRAKRVSSLAIRNRTPYERPTTPRISDQSENPNWLKKLLLSPSRIISSGANKLISSVFSPSSSSSSSSASEEDSDYEDNDADNLVQGSGTVEEMIDKEHQPVLWKKETKKLIEQLIMQEAFSSKECDRLISIIKSRVVDLPIDENTRRDENYKEIPDISSAAVMEAKKWLEEKRLGSTSNPSFDQGAGSLTPNMLPNVAQGEAGSPVDVAKSYMQARPPWASPSVNNIGYTSPSPVGLQLFKEETLSSSKLKKDSLVSGSWNIRDEIRRVRSKATEDMLKTLTSARIDWSELALGSKNIQRSAEKPDTGAAEVAISQNIPELELHEREHSMSKVVAGTKDAILVNGVHTVGSSMSASQDAENSRRQPDGKKLTKAGARVETCELLSEASVEVPFTNEQEGLVTGSQNSSSGQHEEPSQELSQADTKVSSPGNIGGTIRRSKRKRVGKDSRSGRGQGK